MYICIYVYMYICIYVYTYICIYVYTYICIYVCTYICIPISNYKCVYDCVQKLFRYSSLATVDVDARATVNLCYYFYSARKKRAAAAPTSRVADTSTHWVDADQKCC